MSKKEKLNSQKIGKIKTNKKVSNWDEILFRVIKVKNLQRKYIFTLKILLLL